MSKDFRGVKMRCTELAGDRHLVVERSWGDKDKLFFRGGPSAFLNVAQVEELTKRLTEWLDGRLVPAEKPLWEEEL